MKSTYSQIIALLLLSLATLTSCGPDTINNGEEPKSVQSITLSQTTATLSLGETLQLTAKTDPAGVGVTYSVDNATIATVSATGLVTTVAPGTAVVTAKAGDKSASCTITVLEKQEETPQGDILLLDELTNKKYAPGATFEYKGSIQAPRANRYEPEIAFSAAKTATYSKMTLNFTKPTDGGVCTNSTCYPDFSQITSYEVPEANLKIYADAESDEYGYKTVGAPTPMGLHLNLSDVPAGETYTNTMTVTLTPSDGSEPLVWTVNLSIEVTN